ncbi:hypothetical protein NEOLEDRAFT_1181874 [Neolentinus lepideus HHB14362 ss-1]|uniref:Uncharacterized protein n=1 Tax=Neolentinus lepideus HHB14362 ss-1 TaxID=1314782 RepID=A0A165PMD7_9AGAM|nr:hypothetical protein NEOLEDRAFT_1181874 [Neolentinus lepideus HHB14362 ss-1]
MAQARLYAMTEADTWDSPDEFLTGEFDGEPEYLMGSISDETNDCIYFSASSQAGSDSYSDAPALMSIDSDSDGPAMTVGGEDHHIPDDPHSSSYTHDQLASLYARVALMQVERDKHLAQISQLETENKQLHEELETVLHADLISLCEELHQWYNDEMPCLYAAKELTNAVVKKAIRAGDIIPVRN